MFQGFIDEGVGGTLLFQFLDDATLPTEPDAAPTYRVYGQNGLLAGGSGSLSSFESGTVTDATNASPIVITAASHGVTTGQPVTISGVLGNTAANGDFLATAINANTFSLDGSTGNDVYTSGGAWKTTGLYKLVLTGSILSSLEAGKTYTVVVTWLDGGSAKVIQATFTVR